MNDDLPPWVTEAPPDDWGTPQQPPPLKTDAHAQYEYRYGDGSLAFIVARWDAHNGHKKKRFSPFCWTGTEWVAKMLVEAGRRPLFNLGDVYKPHILIVEGEKTAISAAKLVTSDWAVVTWSGGSSTVSATDWAPLRGKVVTIWPDNDEPGFKAAKAILAHVPQAILIDLPLDLPEGWDLADPLPSGFDVLAMLQSRPKTEREAPANPERGVRYGKLLVLSDIDAQTADHRDYYLKGVFSPNELSAVYGMPGCGKTFWVLYVARAISKGREILGKRVHQTNVLYLALEGVAGFEKRLKAEILSHAESEGFYYIAQPVNLLDDPQAKEDAIAAIQGCGAGVLVVDTLNRAIPGGSENDPADMGTFIATLDAIRAATGVHIIIIHHCGKNQAQGMRGHSSLLGASDVVIEIVREENSNVRIATVEKAKDDSDGERFGFSLRVQDLGDDQDGDKITTCIVEEIVLEHDKKITPLTKKEALWLDTLQQLFIRDDNISVVVPEDGMTPQACATRDVVREWAKKRGLVGVAHSVARNGVLSATDRSTFGRMLEALKIKKKIGIYADWIWLVKQ